MLTTLGQYSIQIYTEQLKTQAGRRDETSKAAPMTCRNLVGTLAEVGEMTIITFLMVFLIQNTQNRDSAALHLKLDELIRTIAGAHNAFWTWRN